MRAKRGQATDSHSLAERVNSINKFVLHIMKKPILILVRFLNHRFLVKQVRRGKINERLRCLQDIVPGCYKVYKHYVSL